MRTWMNKQVNDCMNEWMNEWMNVWMNEWMNERMNECMMNAWTHKWLHEWMNAGENLYPHVQSLEPALACKSPACCWRWLRVKSWPCLRTSWPVGTRYTLDTVQMQAFDYLVCAMSVYVDHAHCDHTPLLSMAPWFHWTLFQRTLWCVHCQSVCVSAP